MKILAVIPARGGSKGIPGKNLRPVGGLPLISHMIRAARAAKHVSRLVVSTDDAAIAALAGAEGAGVVRRPAAISGDTASSESALLHVLEELDRTENYRPDYLVFLQCTSPLTTPADIDGTMEELLQRKADTALAVAPFHYFLWQQDAAGGASGINHDKSVRLLRQQRAPQFIETGAIYVMKTDGFIRTKHRFFGRTVMHVVSVDRCLEIDEPKDLLMAEAALRERATEDAAARLPTAPVAIVFDFDGVFTDNRVLVTQDGQEGVWCDRGDGLALDYARAMGWRMLVLSSEQNPVVAARCHKLQLECLQGVAKKEPALRGWLADHQLDATRVVYVGNDLNDLDCLRAVGGPVVVADAHPTAKAAARVVLNSPGGRGAIRELLELLEPRLRQSPPS